MGVQPTETLLKILHLLGFEAQVEEHQMDDGLTLDVKAERFLNDEEANRHLTREYRQGFEVPARI